MLSSRSSTSTNVCAAPGFSRSDCFRYASQPEGLFGRQEPELFQPGPPTQLFIDMLRMRGTFCPCRLTPMVLSAGHFQIPNELPQYGQSRLLLFQASASQLCGFRGSFKVNQC